MSDIETRRATRRRPWPEQVADINSRWPSTAWGVEEWTEALQDYDLMGRILRDVLRVGYEPPNRRGQRGPLEWHEGTARLRAIEAQRDGKVSLDSFALAFAELAGHRSRTQLARRCGLSRSQVHRLLVGEIGPTLEEIERVAKAFDKDPTFFLEYRVHVVTSMFASRMMAAPETSVDIVHRLGIQEMS